MILTLKISKCVHLLPTSSRNGILHKLNGFIYEKATCVTKSHQPAVTKSHQKFLKNQKKSIKVKKIKQLSFRIFQVESQIVKKINSYK